MCEPLSRDESQSRHVFFVTFFSMIRILWTPRIWFIPRLWFTSFWRSTVDFLYHKNDFWINKRHYNLTYVDMIIMYQSKAPISWRQLIRCPTSSDISVADTKTNTNLYSNFRKHYSMNSQPIQYAFHMNNKERNPFPSQNNFTSNNICAGELHIWQSTVVHGTPAAIFCNCTNFYANTECNAGAYPTWDPTLNSQHAPTR